MDLEIRCHCGGSFTESARTRRRVIYTCNQCGKELSVRKSNSSKETTPSPELP